MHRRLATVVALALIVGRAIGAQPEPATEPAQAIAQQPEAPAPSDSLFAFDEPVNRGWTFRFEPGYWYAAPRGDLTLPGSVGPVDFGGSTFELDDEADLSSLDADDPTSAFLARAHLSNDRWRCSLGVTNLSTSGQATADAPGRLGDAFFATGDAVETDFQMTTFDLSASFIMLHGPKGDEPGDPDRFRFTLEILAGARFENIDVDVNVEPGSGPRPPELGVGSSASALFGQPIVGTRLSMDLFEDFTIEVGVTVGYWSVSGGSTASTWDILAAFTWRPIHNVGIEVGYQYLGLSAEREVDDGSFEFTGSSAGLFGGLAIQF